MLAQNYQLIDFGRGRKLERFGYKVLDRPCPAADGILQESRRDWKKATHRFDDKQWIGLNMAESDAADKEPTDDNWTFQWESVSLGLKRSPFGHVGVFPEQVENWEWIRKLARTRKLADKAGTKPKALNLFSYTGGSTLALASSGFEVTHVDASKPSVLWARRNAAKSMATDLPIRWIVDDARDFVQREIRRKQRYDVIVLDPPAFGHGASGRRWEIDNDLPILMEDCRQLLSEAPIAMLLTGHSPIQSMEHGPLDKQTFGRVSQNFSRSIAKRATLIDLSGRELDCGYQFRWFN